ncbi:Apoptosis facilitator Bcl-2-like protein 14 [Galemys pyrenaicus]|uniref:Apoptosis facilitator Bcl-2-like protein 14 n=1 Tax=Galemys pyrenaicus TaxID=202257 RepID=A0A8J6DMI9_GALPY|nr:Apoptosis facilitator Bcl-2-like protein 14 [Galemys pyrenaicus]
MQSAVLLLSGLLRRANFVLALQPGQARTEPRPEDPRLDQTDRRSRLRVAYKLAVKSVPEIPHSIRDRSEVNDILRLILPAVTETEAFLHPIEARAEDELPVRPAPGAKTAAEGDAEAVRLGHAQSAALGAAAGVTAAGPLCLHLLWTRPAPCPRCSRGLPTAPGSPAPAPAPNRQAQGRRCTDPKAASGDLASGLPAGTAPTHPLCPCRAAMCSSSGSDLQDVPLQDDDDSASLEFRILEFYAKHHVFARSSSAFSPRLLRTRSLSQRGLGGRASDEPGTQGPEPCRNSSSSEKAVNLAKKKSSWRTLFGVVEKQGAPDPPRPEKPQRASHSQHRFPGLCSVEQRAEQEGRPPASARLCPARPRPAGVRWCAARGRFSMTGAAQRVRGRPGPGAFQLLLLHHIRGEQHAAGGRPGPAGVLARVSLSGRPFLPLSPHLRSLGSRVPAAVLVTPPPHVSRAAVAPEVVSIANRVAEIVHSWPPPEEFQLEGFSEPKRTSSPRTLPFPAPGSPPTAASARKDGDDQLITKIVELLKYSGDRLEREGLSAGAPGAQALLGWGLPQQLGRPPRRRSPAPGSVQRRSRAARVRPLAPGQVLLWPARADASPLAQLRRDPSLRSGFPDGLSYSVFKSITDQFLQGVDTRGESEAKAQSFKAALAIDVMAKLTTVDNHPMNRVLGFGSKYLKENFSPWVQQHGGWVSAGGGLQRQAGGEARAKGGERRDA